MRTTGPVGNAIAWPDKLGTSPMADDSNRSPSGKREGGVEFRIYAPGVENEQGNAGWDGRTYIAKSNFQARTGTGKIPFSLFG